MYQLRFVQPSCKWGAADLIFWRLHGPFTCASLPSNHHKSCNHNTHICSTASLNKSSSTHYTPIISLLSLVASSTLSSTHRIAPTIAKWLEYPGATQQQTAVMMNHSEKKNHIAPPPRRLLPPPLREQRQRQRRLQRAPRGLYPPPLREQRQKETIPKKAPIPKLRRKIYFELKYK